VAKEFPDLTGDGKTTQADILKGRGVFKKGGFINGFNQQSKNPALYEVAWCEKRRKNTRRQIS
jgi:hypothetical protein